MTYDAATMTVAAQELRPFEGGRIERVYQTGRHELVLALYHRGDRGLLLLSASPEHARAHLTARLPERPASPPAFCMLLRRHLEGQRLLRLVQEPGERVLTLVAAARDDLGEPAEKRLVVEVMGRHSNIILLHPDGRVADAIKRVGPGRSRHRQVLPGTPYLPPPPARGTVPSRLRPEDLLAGPTPGLSLWRALIGAVRGAGPTLARQAALRCGLDPDRPVAGPDAAAALTGAVRALDADLAAGRFSPNVLEDPGGEPLEYWVFPLLGPGTRREFASTGEMLDHVHSRLARAEAVRAARERAGTVLRREFGRVEDLRAELGRELEAASADERLRRWGELLTANLYRLKENVAEVVLPDHLEAGAPPVAVPLDPRLSPAENAQVYFRRYAHARRAAAALRRRLGEVDEERTYLLRKLEELAAGADAAGLAAELAVRGYRVAPPRAGERREGPHPPFARYRTGDGLLVLVGRNNRENEELTFHHAAPADLWFHTREIPGSHVILKTGGEAPPAASLRQAAQIAAWHSRGRHSSQVPVDYTERRNVRKPPGARPGKVIYHGQRTLHVTPAEEVVASLRER